MALFSIRAREMMRVDEFFISFKWVKNFKLPAPCHITHYTTTFVYGSTHTIYPLNQISAHSFTTATIFVVVIVILAENQSKNFTFNFTHNYDLHSSPPHTHASEYAKQKAISLKHIHIYRF